MISLEQFLRKEDQDQLLKYYEIEDIDKWLFETYEDYLNNKYNRYISEAQFYHNKYNFSVLDMPEYWFWQDKLYERLDSSLIIYSELFAKLFKQLKGITKVIIDNEYSIGLEYNNEFSEGSNEFRHLLDFANYFIRSKRNENGQLPNPFFIEGRKPKELIDYKYKKAYHITNKYAYEKIKKYGLYPKSKSKLSDYEYRIYLWIPEYITLAEIESFGHINLILLEQSISNNTKHDLYQKININEDLIILEINLEKFEKDHQKQLKLFGDPAYNKKAAVFTEEPIPSEYIKNVNIDDLKFNNI